MRQQFVLRYSKLEMFETELKNFIFSSNFVHIIITLLFYYINYTDFNYSKLLI